MLWETVTSLFEKCERVLEMSKYFSTFWRLLKKLDFFHLEMLISVFSCTLSCLQLERIFSFFFCCGARNKDGALLRDPTNLNTDKYLANALRNTQKETIMLPYGSSTPCLSICLEGSVNAMAVPQPGKGRR